MALAIVHDQVALKLRSRSSEIMSYLQNVDYLAS
jgi:hypothetical protein